MTAGDEIWGPAEAESKLPVCGPDDVRLTVSWEAEGTGLRGQVIAENVSGRRCRLPGKPGVVPVGLDGEPLPVRTTITLEGRSPGYAVLEAGGRAAAPVRWDSWCGEAAGDQALVTWSGHESVTGRATVTGPRQPSCQGRSGAIWAGWFDALESGQAGM
jgi:hypothetical protein